MTKQPDALFSESEMPRNEQLAVVDATPATLIRAVIDRGITAESVGVVERLVALAERQEARQAEKDFNAAFVALQADLPTIIASTEIPNRGKYERFEDVMRQISPHLKAHGFSVSFSMDFRESRVLETCHLRHISGHSQSNSFAVRTGKADSETQADCKAATTAKRNALLNCLNIVIRQDVYQDEESNPANEGAPVSVDQALYLHDLLKQCGSKVNVPRFLAYAQVKAVEEIAANRFEALAEELRKRLNS